MNRILLTVLASATLCCTGTPKAFGVHESQDRASHPFHSHQDKTRTEKTAAETIKELEDRLEKIKPAGASLPPALEAEFAYELGIVGVTISALKNSHLKDPKRYVISGHRHLNHAEHIIKGYEHHLAREKKAEERKAKIEERRLRAEERKTKAEERKVKREEERKVRKTAQEEAAKGEGRHRADEKGLDHGKSEGADASPPGSEASKLATEDKKQ